MDTATNTVWRVTPWNKGKLLGQKPPLNLKEIWAIGFDYSLIIERANLHCSTSPSTVNCADVIWSGFVSMMSCRAVQSRHARLQTKTQRPVQFEITEQTRDAIAAWITDAHLKSEQFLFPSRVSQSPHLSTRQYSRIVETWIASIGLNPAAYGTHSLRRTKATLIYRRTKNLRAVQLLLGHAKLESTVRYFGIEVDDALEIAEQTEV